MEKVTKARLLRELLYYVVICGFLAVVNWVTSPGTWWVLWVVGGWGLILLLQVGEWLIDRQEK